MTYEIEVEECAAMPLTFREDHGWGKLNGVKLEPFKHFKLVTQNKDAEGQELLVTMSEKDKYYPRDTGVYNVYLEADDTENVNKNQLWWYDDIDLTICSVANPKECLLEGGNFNFAAYKNKLLNAQRFSYNKNDKHLNNDYTKRAMGVTRTNLRDHGNVESFLIKDNDYLKWDIKYVGTS